MDDILALPAKAKFPIIRRPKLPGTIRVGPTLFTKVQIRSEISYVNKVFNLLSAAFYICDFSPFELAKFKLDNLGVDEAVDLVKRLSENAIDYLFRDPDTEVIPMLPYANHWDCNLIYSLRRALPPPVQDPKPEEISPGLFVPVEEKAYFSYDEVLDMSQDLIRTRINRPTFPSLISNKSTLEAPRKLGGRDYISSKLLQVVKWQEGFLLSKLTPSVEAWGCIPSEFDQFLAIGQVKQLDSYALFCIAFSISRAINEVRPPLLGECIIRERGNKYRIPHIPEWHNQILGEFVGSIGFKVVSFLCPNTFRQQHYSLKAEKSRNRIIYSGDFKSATDYIPHHVARAAWEVILNRTDLTMEQRAPLLEAISMLICPHMILDSDQVKEYRNQFNYEAFIDLDPYAIDDVIIHTQTAAPPGFNNLEAIHARPEKDYISQIRDSGWLDYFSHDRTFEDNVDATDWELKNSSYVRSQIPEGYDEKDYIAPTPLERSTGQIHVSLATEESSEYTDSKSDIIHYDNFGRRDFRNFGKRFGGVSTVGLPAYYKTKLVRFRDAYNRRHNYPKKVSYMKDPSNIHDVYKLYLGDDRAFISKVPLSGTYLESLQNFPQGRVTVRGLHMCYGVSFPALTLINYMCHAHVPRNRFIITGDDNTSIHYDQQSIDQLRFNHSRCGLVENQPKTKIRRNAYLHAEVFGLITEKDDTVRLVDGLHLKSLFPVDDVNHYLTVPRSIYGKVKTMPGKYQQRIYQYIFWKYEREYRYLLDNGFNIFTLPVGAPIFPIKLDGMNYPTRFYSDRCMSRAFGSVCRTTFSELYSRVITTRSEKGSRTVPDLESEYARPEVYTAEELTSALSSFAVPNQLRNPYPYKAEEYKSPEEIIDILNEDGFSPLPGPIEEQKLITTSILGILSGASPIPEDQRFTPDDIGQRVFIREGSYETFLDPPPAKVDTVITVCERRRKIYRDVGRQQGGVLYLLWEDKNYHKVDLAPIVDWARRNGKQVFL